MTTPTDAVAVARTAADVVHELAWATRPGQVLPDADRYAVTTALAAMVGALPQVLAQLTHQAPLEARQQLHVATVTVHDLAHAIDAAAQQLACHGHRP